MRKMKQPKCATMPTTDTDMKITIQYAHAVKNPFDNDIPRPFELRNVDAELSTRVDDGCIATVTANGQAFIGSSDASMQEAVNEAIFEAEYSLMAASRARWKQRNN